MKKLYATLAAAGMAVTAMAGNVITPAMLSRVTINSAKTVQVNGFRGIEAKAVPMLQTAQPRKAGAVGDTPLAGEEKWKSVGTCTMADFVIADVFGLDGSSFEVELEQSESDATKYRIQHPYKNWENQVPTALIYDESKATDMVIHTCGDNNGFFYFDRFNTGYSYEGSDIEAVMNVTSLLASYPFATVYSAYPDAFGTFDGTVFKLGAQFSGYYCALVLYNGKNLIGNGNGQFRIALPGAKDYSVKVAVEAQCTDDNVFNFAMTYGADVDKVKYAILQGIYPPSSGNFGVIAQYGTDATAATLKGGSIPYTDVADNGAYTIFVVAVDDAGAVLEGATAYYDVNIDDAASWQDLGTARYTDDILNSVYKNYATDEYDVAIQVSSSKPGYYRVVNPYTDNYPLKAKNYHEGNHKHFMYIDASDPDRVVIETSAIGVDLGYGAMHVSSLGHLYREDGYTDEQIDAMATAEGEDKVDAWGKLDKETKTITFPVDALRTQEFGDNGTMYIANQNGKFKLVLSELEGVSSISADSDAETPTVYYNLQGVRVDNPAAGQLVIRKQGAKATKILVR